MKLNKIEKAAYAAAEALLKEKGLEEEKSYSFGISETRQNRKPASQTLNLTIPYEKVLVAALKGQGWKLAKKYVNHGSPNFFCSDIHNDESELQDLIRHHGKRVEMVRMVMEREFNE